MKLLDASENLEITKGANLIINNRGPNTFKKFLQFTKISNKHNTYTTSFQQERREVLHKKKLLVNSLHQSSKILDKHFNDFHIYKNLFIPK